MNTKFRGSILLIAGCATGAGMLGIPVMTGAAGFFPTSLLFVLVWAFMALSAIVLAELVLSYKGAPVHLVGLTKDTLGTPGALLCSLLFVFLFYAVMTAYILASSILITEFTGISQTIASCLVVLGIFAVIARGLRLVDSLNQLLMVGFVVCYFLLVSFGLPAVDTSRLFRYDLAASLLSLPILVVSFGYHNLIPSLAGYLEQNKKKLISAILIGSLIPLAVYLLWEFVILGVVPMDSLEGWKLARNGGEMITQVLVDRVGDKRVVYISQGFALFAIATSFLPVSFSFLDFLKESAPKKTKSAILALFVLLPPFTASLLGPDLFLEALDFAGGICAVVLFGILPALMVFKRKKKVGAEPFTVATTPVLAFLLIGSFCILTIELLHLQGVIT